MATITLGSADAPVILDPAQIITEAHWPDRFTHIAFALEIRARTTRISDSEFCTPPTVGPPIPGGYDRIYLSGNEYYYTSGDGVSEPWIRSQSGAWQAPPAAVEVTGTPDISAANFPHGAWQIVPEANIDTIEEAEEIGSTTVLSAENNLSAAFEPDTGADTSITVPGREEMFQTGVTPTFALRSNLYTSSSPVCATDGFLNGTVREHATDLVYSDPFEVPLAGIAATHRGKTYNAIAARLIPLPVGSVDLARRAWILCERVE